MHRPAPFVQRSFNSRVRVASASALPLLVAALGCDDFTCADYATCEVPDAATSTFALTPDAAAASVGTATTYPSSTTGTKGAATTSAGQLSITGKNAVDASTPDQSIEASSDTAQLTSPSTSPTTHPTSPSASSDAGDDQQPSIHTPQADGGSYTDAGSNIDASAASDDAEPPSKLSNGDACESANECTSNHCVDGVCCDTACDGVCAACNLEEVEGTCQATTRDDACGTPACRPDTECLKYEAVDPDLNCASLDACLASANCNELPVDVDTACQNGAGKCDGEGECVVPDKKSLGETCDANTECGSDHCATTIDGVNVCCDTTCDGVCQACSQSGRCDATPPDDVECGVVDCPTDTTCAAYPDDVTNNRCAAFGQCITTQSVCAPTFANAGTSCGTGEICDGAGVCENACEEGLVYCGGACIDPVTNNESCGATGDCTGDSAGEVCASDATCVKSKCKRWGAASLVGVGEGRWPQIVVDGASNVTILAGTSAYQRTSSAQWTSANPITTAERNSAALGVTNAGTVWLAWESEATVYARSYSPTQGWQSSATPLNIVEEGDTVSGVKLAVNATENAMVSWKTSNNEIQVTRYAEAQGWQGAQTLNEPEGATATNEALVVDSFGNGVGLWREADGSLLMSEYDRVQGSWDVANDFNFGRQSWGPTSVGSNCRDGYFLLNTVAGSDWSSWSLVVDIEERKRVGPDVLRGGPNFVLTNPIGSCGEDDSRFVAWEEHPTSDNSTRAYVMRFEDDWDPQDPRWESIHPLNVGEGSPDPIAMATDRYGNAFVGWAERDGNALTVLVSRYDRLSDTWSDSIPLATGTLDERSTNFGVGVAADPGGSGYVTWRLNGNVYLAEYK